VISNSYYNKKSNLILACPITSKNKKNSFDVKMKTKKIEGFILAEHVKSIDYKTRKIKKIDSVSKKTLDEVLDLVKLILN
jgi:mRNA interferase MazF